MNYKVEVAKNGEHTLILNDICIYSKYNPKKDAEKFIHKEYDENAKAYFLVGLGLGYHLETLLKLSSNKPIFVLVLEEEELELFEKFSSIFNKIKEYKNVKLILTLESEIDLSQYQIIIPFSWMKGIGYEHKLHGLLEDIKIRQISYLEFNNVLKENFEKNSTNNDSSISKFKNKFKGKWACLVSAGPSLDTTIDLLKVAKDKCYILAVGSALNTLLKNNIEPDAVIITDAQVNVVSQIKNRGYNDLLFYLSTANHEMTQVHEGKRVILYQEGYALAEIEATKRKEDVLKTGGSVATTGFSILEYMGFQNVILFGQDLGFQGNHTHSNASTSRKDVASGISYRKIIANSGEYIHTTPNLSTYHRWFERAARKTSMELYNTAWNGAKVEGVPYVNTMCLIDKIKTLLLR